ncbi:MAG: ATP-dependent sacrificial sulfur transferase LarE [Nitrospirota bacterium]
MDEKKLIRLTDILKDLQSVVLAYSGGVDSTFLLRMMKFSGIDFIAVTGSSEIRPRVDLETAEKMVQEFGVEHIVIKTEELSGEEFTSNTPDRCFFCKDELFGKLTRMALSRKFKMIADGSIGDDLLDYRPGNRALEKYKVRSPLIEAGLMKEEVRGFSRRLGLPTWNKPSSACLATRIPYGQRITTGTLGRIEKAEELIRSFGYGQVRVRDHAGIARIEVSEELVETFVRPEVRKNIAESLKAMGFTFVSLDLEGFRSGSMNRLLKK